MTKRSTVTRRLRTRVIVVGVVVALAVLTVALDRVTDDAIEPDALWARIEAGNAPVVLDVRTAEEFADGHVPGARHIHYRALDDHLATLPAGDEPVVVYCMLGPRAWIARGRLRQAGHERVRLLAGHWFRWQREGLPVERP